MEIILPAQNSSYGLTLAEIIQQVSDELRNTDINAKITRWINMAIVNIASNYVFGSLHRYASVNTVAATPDIPLATDFFWLKTIEIPLDARKLYPRDEQRIAEQYPQYRTMQGSVQYYYLNGLTMGLWQVPSGIKSVEYSYQRRPNKLDLLADINNYPDLPAEWHELISQKATSTGFRYEGNTEDALASENKEAKLLLRLGTSVYRRTDETFVLGGPTNYSRPPRPRLPANFPRV